MQLASSLTCVLVMHYEAVNTDYPNSPLVARMRQCRGIGEAKLLEWANTIRRSFHRSNASFFPMNELEDEEVCPVRTMKDFAKDCVQAIGANTLTQAEMLTKIDRLEVKLQRAEDRNEQMEQAVTALLAGQQRIECLLARALGATSSSQLVTTAASATSASADPRGFSTPAGQITSFFQSQRVRLYTPSTEHVPDELLSGLKSVQLSRAVFRWYNEDLYNCHIIKDSTPAKEAKWVRVRGKIQQAVGYMQDYFFPPGAVVGTKRCDDQRQYEEWSAALECWCTAGAESARAFCQEHVDLTAASEAGEEEERDGGAGSATKKRRRKEGPDARDRNVVATLESMNKRIGQLQKHHRHLLEPLLRPEAEPVAAVNAVKKPAARAPARARTVPAAASAAPK